MRRARIEDVGAMHRIMRDPEAMRFWSTLPHESVKTTADWVRSMLSPPQESDDFIVTLDGAVIGKFGAWALPDFGYLLDPAHWGKGYASEAMAAFLDHRRRQGSLFLTADTDPRNTASIRLLQRHGFVETGRATKTWLIGGQWFDSIYWRRDL
ncbi:GNAT family N-acetyltransferase [Sphingomonas astaxanthinifaciens]|uniref:GNAT family N-acetyltransferase n=1 Tax=Sphingomonas astaxanthinifaciens TaxID=407019 RepID=UPI0024E0ED16|nr:GNAT family N-acetyltransferase [Sphingomonas astaxanthinifaciens]